MKKTVLLAFTSLIAVTAQAQLRIAEIFTSHMVLQQNARIPFHGRANPGEEVEIHCSWLQDETQITQVAADGHWSVTIPVPAASLDPQTVEITSGEDKITLRDVLIGDVWLCSGQSNMEWRIIESAYPPAMTQAASYPFIRHFKVNHEVSLTPLDTLDAGKWQVCNDNTVDQFSAVAYFFARQLAEKYKIPIGLVNSSWGGSQVESWISTEGMMESDLFRDYAGSFPADWAAADALSLSKIKRYIFKSDRPNSTKAEEAAWFDPACDISKWAEVTVNTAWDWQQIWAYRGSGLMATDFTLDENAAKQNIWLGLGNGDLPAEIRVNGQKVWSGKNAGNVRVLVPASVLKPGKNRLLFIQRLGNSTGWVEMGMKGSDADFFIKTITDSVSLANKWRAIPLLSEPYYFVHNSNNLGTAIYNAMIHPLITFPIKGVIWYQGETNAIRAQEYRQSFPLLIRDWRRLWGEDFPFLFVQLANWQADKGTSKNGGSEWAELREAQTKALELPKTGMAVIIDVGDSKDIHPKNKIAVGQRLAREAMRVAYGENLTPGSPVNPEVKFSGGKAIVKYPVALGMRASAPVLKGFELAGEDHVFHDAQAMIDGQTVQVSCAEVPKPVAVRYAWADDPFEANLITQEGFPVSPFRSDDWPCKTAGVKFDR